MFKILLIIIFSIALYADSISLGTKVSNGTTTYKPKVVKKSKKKRVKVHQKIRKDDHRYDKRYRDFDYDRYGYYNDDGFYFGYFDRRGYFYNNIYFEFDLDYNYNDRLYRRGYFSPHVHHYRRYRYYDDNDWNRVHRYREPNVIVYGNYYENNAPCYQDRTPPPPRRAYYIREERDRGRVVSRPYRREHTIRRREEYHNSDRRGRDYYRRDDNYRHRSSSHEYRRRDTGRVIHHRFSSSGSISSHDKDKKRYKSKSNGRLRITK